MAPMSLQISHRDLIGLGSRACTLIALTLAGKCSRLSCETPCVEALTALLVESIREGL
jgi:hypothetical protein